jgi:RNA polymerase sigma factor (sigma-70 family)
MADDDIRDDHAQPSRGANDAPLVTRVREGDPDAFGLLYDRWFDRVVDLAYRILRDADAAADVAQDAFVAAWRNLDRLEDFDAFGGWLLRIARNGALDRKRKDDRARPADAERLAMIERARTRPEDRLGTLDDPVRVAEDASYVALLWDAADALGDRDRDVLDLNLRHGLAPAEIADVVGINRNAANQLVHRVRQRLAGAVGARLLWRGGEPACAALRAALVSAEVERFGADAVRVTERHAAACADCTARGRVHLAPEKMFAAIPVIALPSLKAKVAHALAGAGLPMDGSAALDAGDTPDPDGAGRTRGRVRRGVLAAAVATGLVVAVLIFTAGALSDGTGPVVSVGSDTTATSADARGSSGTAAGSSSSSSTGSSPTRPDGRRAGRPRPGPAVPTAGPDVAPGVAPGVTPGVTPTVAPAGTAGSTAATTTTTVPVEVSFRLTRSSVPPSYAYDSGAPRVVWRVTGAASVIVRDHDGGVLSTAASGDERICPGAVLTTGNGTSCEATPGDYEYVLEAYDAGGAMVKRVSRPLTVLAPEP